MERHTLEALLRPRSVALVGASANPNKMGNVALRNMSRGRFKLYPVNPKEEAILGLTCYRSVSDIPEELDLAVVALPAEQSLAAVRECVRKGVKVVAVTSSGFRESGQVGERIEHELIRTVRATRTRLLGPNTMGVFVPLIGLDTLFIPHERLRRPGPGSVAVVSQSGAVSVSILEKAESVGLGISCCIGLGNKGDIQENELLEHLASDPDTSCMAMYLESFSDGRGFVRSAREVTGKKPIVIVKSGRTPAGSEAARSHTGALAASSDVLVSRALAQAGVIRAYDEDELLDVAKALVHLDHIKGDRICVLASAGGYGVIATDYITSAERGTGMRMAELSARTQNALRGALPPFSSARNPVDLTINVTDESYESALKAVQADPGVDGILMSLELHPPSVTDRLVKVAVERSSSKGAPLVVSVFGGDRTAEVLRRLEQNGVPAYPTLLRAATALKALSERGAYLRRMNKTRKKTR